MNRSSEITEWPISERGFTIIELLVAMAISLVVMAAIYSTYRSQQASYIVQDQVSIAQQNLRAAMYSITREIRTAGFNPTQIGGNLFEIKEATDTAITFTADNGAGANANNGTLEGDETIRYFLSGTDLMRQVGGTAAQKLAENIEAIGFAYAFDATGDGVMDTSGNNIIWAVGGLNVSLDTDNNGVIDVSDDTDNDDIIDGTALATVPLITQIKSVRVWMLARTPQQIRSYQDANRYVVGRSVITPQAGFMYRLVMETVKCRNM
jgi:type IV pilus assembly protein PilW